MEHDRAWPGGPTCACNLGPCCRRHHRVKQTGWTKTRTATGVWWTGPTGRSWFGATPHEPAAPAVRPLTTLRVPHPLELLSDLELEAELHTLFPDSAIFDDPPSSRADTDADADAKADADADADAVAKADDDDDDEFGAPETFDSLGDRLRTGDTTWTIDLDDPYAWDDIPGAELTPT